MAGSLAEERAVARYVRVCSPSRVCRLTCDRQVRDEHRQDYDPGRGGWGAQAQRAEIERRREVEERYNDAQDVPGAVAGGGGDWKDVSENPLKRARSPDDEGEGGRGVRIPNPQVAAVD